MKFKRLLLEGYGTIFDDSCTLLEGAKELKAVSHQNCKTVVKFEPQEAQMYDSFTLLHTLAQNGNIKSSPATMGPKIQTTAAGVLWGPYLMTVVYF